MRKNKEIKRVAFGKKGMPVGPASPFKFFAAGQDLVQEPRSRHQSCA
jgi:hypothetical protein